MDRFESFENFFVGKIQINSMKRKYVDYQASYYWREKGSLNGLRFVGFHQLLSFTVSKSNISLFADDRTV